MSSSKKTDKTKKQFPESPLQETDHETLTQVSDRHVESRTIVITVNSLKNIAPLFAISDIKLQLKYLDKDLGETHLIPVTDDENLPIEDSFEIEIDIESPKQLDLLASNPVFITALQLTGSQDPVLYEQLQKSETENIINKSEIDKVESLFSLYEAFNGERPSLELFDTSKKKKIGKKEKIKNDNQEKSQVRSKSKSTAGSKSSKTSKTSKTSKSESKTTKSDISVVKTETYGMCVIDLIPLFYGETTFSETLTIQPIKQSLKLLSTYKNFPEVSLTVSIKDNAAFINITNILNLTVESICNVPSLMLAEMDCKISAILPLFNSTCAAIFHNPKINNKEPVKGQVPKRWPGLHDIGYNANTTKYFIDDNFKEIINKNKLNIEEAFKEDNSRIEYNYLKRNVLFKYGQSEFASHVITHRKLVLEIFLTPKSKKQKTYEGQLDDLDDLSHGHGKGSKIPPHLHLMAVLDLVALLYPGVTKLHIATPLTNFTYEEAAKAGLDDSFFLPKPRSEVNAGRSSKTKLEAGKKAKKNSEKKEKNNNKKDKFAIKDDKNLNSQLPTKPEEPPLPEPILEVYNEDGKPCFILVELELLKPLTPKIDIEQLKADLHTLQMEALQSSKTILNKIVADDYHVQTIKEIIDDLNKHWLKYNENITTIPMPSDYAGFLEYLQKAGAYQVYVSSITTSATLLITNKYKCLETDFKSNKNYQNLISEVYTELISQMHSVLNNFISHGMKATEAKYLTPCDLSYFYAKEACELKLYKLAERYFMERIINNTNRADFWFDFAIYHVEIDNNEKAFECSKEAIALNCTSKYALLLFGTLLTNKNSIQEAEICFLNILILESKWVEGWCVLYLYYQKCSRIDGMEMAMDMARNLFDEQSNSSDFLTEFQDLAWSWKNIPKTLFFNTAVLLLKMRLYSWVELALAEEVLVPKHYGYVNYLLAVVSYYKKDFEHALEHVNEAKESLGANNEILALSGHILHAQSKLNEAKNEYYRIIESYNRAQDIHLVYLNSADILSKLGEGQTARKFVLITCKFHQTPHVWFTAGKLYYLQNDLLSAEECFNEANMKDNRHGDVWGYLSLINLKLNRTHEAEQCYQQAVKCILDENLNELIVQEFKKVRSL